ncbi:MAG: Fic family protein [Atopobiaceae bacterium]|nr:Fic family protein [Atopobiaceae bacterium]
MSDLMEKLIERDRALASELPNAFLHGAHLSLMYALGHCENRLNEMEVFRLIRDHPELELNVQTILYLYDVLTSGTEYGGRGFKSKQIYVESEDYFYITLPPEETPDAMRALCARYSHLNHPKPEDFDDIFRFLLDFICIHPMEDANGRLSVFLVQLLLRKAGLEAAPFLPFDAVLGKFHLRQYQLHILKASGSFYGQKPIEYDLFVEFAKELVLESYDILGAACRTYPL